MTISKAVINDLFPLYVENECSVETRALVDEYLEQHPEQAAEFQKAMTSSLPRAEPSPRELDEVKSLHEVRRRLRVRSWLMGVAIFFSLAPFSFLHTRGKTYWLFAESPVAAMVYGVFAIVAWIIYAIIQRRSTII